MRFIATAKSFLTKEERDKLSQIGNILYESKILPIIGIDTDHPNNINYNFISSLYPSRTGFYSTTSIIPPIDTQPLRAKNLVGWQVAIAVLDSGFNNTSILANPLTLLVPEYKIMYNMEHWYLV
jgi:hypothetical protein